MLPDLPDVGVWRLETKGMNAAFELPGTIDIIQMASSAGQFLTGRLRIEHRTSKKAGETRRFIVPVIDLDISMKSLMAGEATPPAIESGASGEAAALEAGDSPAPAEVIESGDGRSPGSDLISSAQRKRMFAIAKASGISNDDIKDVVLGITGQSSTAAIPKALYDEVIAAIENAAAPTHDEQVADEIADALFADDRPQDVA